MSNIDVFPQEWIREVNEKAAVATRSPFNRLQEASRTRVTILSQCMPVPSPVIGEIEAVVPGENHDFFIRRLNGFLVGRPNGRGASLEKGGDAC